MDGKRGHLTIAKIQRSEIPYLIHRKLRRFDIYHFHALEVCEFYHVTPRFTPGGPTGSAASSPPPSYPVPPLEVPRGLLLPLPHLIPRLYVMIVYDKSKMR